MMRRGMVLGQRLVDLVVEVAVVRRVVRIALRRDVAGLFGHPVDGLRAHEGVEADGAFRP